MTWNIDEMTVTLKSKQAVEQWLNDNGFEVVPAVYDEEVLENHEGLTATVAEDHGDFVIYVGS